MPPVPKKKHTRARSGRRRNSPSKKRVKIPSLSVCTSCKQLKEPHKACPHCGEYKSI